MTRYRRKETYIAWQNKGGPEASDPIPEELKPYVSFSDTGRCSIFHPRERVYSTLGEGRWAILSPDGDVDAISSEHLEEHFDNLDLEAERDRYRAAAGELEEHVRVLQTALLPFAQLEPSSLYPADGSACEGYEIVLNTDKRNLPDFTGADLRRARDAMKQGPAALSRAFLSIIAERRRQIGEKGYTPVHDDQYAHDELVRAAVCYAYLMLPSGDPQARKFVEHLWPWPQDVHAIRQKDRRDALVVAAALLLAELERMDRAAARAARETEGPVNETHA